MSFWEHASSAFPEFFQGNLLISAVRVTPAELSHIRYHRNGGEYDPMDVQTECLYLIGDFVGKVLKHSSDSPEDNTIGDILYTPTSYYSYSSAMYEASLIAQDTIRVMVRHLLYTQQATPMSVDLMTDLVLFTGVIPSLDNDHALW